MIHLSYFFAVFSSLKLFFSYYQYCVYCKAVITLRTTYNLFICKEYFLQKMA